MIRSLESLFKRFTGQDAGPDKPVVPTELTVEDLGLRAVNVDGDQVEFTTTWGNRTLFRARGRIGGNLRRAVDLTFPLQTDLPGGTIPGRTMVTLSVAPMHVSPLSTPELVRSSHVPLPPDGQVLEFLFVHDGDEIRLTFRLSHQVPVSDFEEVQDTRPLFRTLPPVAQMAAVLGAVARGRRAALNLLEEFGGHPEEVAELRQHYPPNSELADATVRQLHALLAGTGNPHPLGELAAMCLFAEIAQKTLTRERIQAAAAEGDNPPVSPASAYLVSRALLAEIEETAWEDAFPGTWESCRETSRKPALLGIARTLRSPRTPRHLDLLDEVARQTNSRRVEAFVAEGRSRDPQLVHRDQAELHQLLVAAGCRADPAAVAALSVFVDIEAGNLTDETARYVPSLYAVLAVAGAYGTPLRALQCADSLAVLRQLTHLCAGAVLGQFADSSLARQLRYLATPEDVDAVVAEGLDFTGRVLVRLPLAERLTEADLRLLRQLGQPFATCVVSASEPAPAWCLEPAPGQRFEGTVLAQWRPGTPESYPALTVDRDSGNELVLRLARGEEALDQAPEGSSWGGVVLQLPPLDALQLPWTELTQEQLLGRTGTLAKDAQTLESLYPALREVLQTKPVYEPMPQDLWKAGMKQLSSGYFKSLLGDAVEPAQQAGLFAEMAQRPAEFLEILAPLRILGPVDPSYLALELVPVDGLTYHRVRRERLAELLRSREPAVRQAAVTMLATAGLPEDRAHPLPLQFELLRTCSDPDPAVATAAFRALARVSLGGVVPFPTAVRLKQPEEAATAEDNLAEQLEALWPRLGELAPSSRRTSIGRAAAEVERLGRRGKLADLLSGMNTAFREDKDKAVVLLCLLSQSELVSRRLGSLQKWKFFAYSKSQSLADLLAGTPPEGLWADYLEFQRESESVMADSPTRLGSGQPVQLYRARRPVGPWEREGELSAFFLDLVEMCARLDPDQIRVCRVRANLPPIEAYFFWDVAIDPRLVDVYEPKARRFTPQMHHLCLTPAQVGYEDDDWEDLEALVTLFTESRPTFRLLPKLSREVAGAFELPEQYSRQILKMLVDLGAESVYEF